MFAAHGIVGGVSSWLKLSHRCPFFSLFAVAEDSGKAHCCELSMSRLYFHAKHVSKPSSACTICLRALSVPPDAARPRRRVRADDVDGARGV